MIVGSSCVTVRSLVCDQFLCRFQTGTTGACPNSLSIVLEIIAKCKGGKR